MQYVFWGRALADWTVNCSEPGCLRLGSLEAEPKVGILINVIFLREQKGRARKLSEFVDSAEVSFSVTPWEALEQELYYGVGPILRQGVGLLYYVVSLSLATF